MLLITRRKADTSCALAHRSSPILLVRPGLNSQYDLPLNSFNGAFSTHVMHVDLGKVSWCVVWPLVHDHKNEFIIHEPTLLELFIGSQVSLFKNPLKIVARSFFSFLHPAGLHVIYFPPSRPAAHQVFTHI